MCHKEREGGTRELDKECRQSLWNSGSPSDHSWQCSVSVGLWSCRTEMSQGDIAGDPAFPAVVEMTAVCALAPFGAFTRRNDSESMLMERESFVSIERRSAEAERSS